MKLKLLQRKPDNHKEIHQYNHDIALTSALRDNAKDLIAKADDGEERQQLMQEWARYCTELDIMHIILERLLTQQSK